MTLDRAATLELSGRYGELLRESLRELEAAANGGRPADEVRWTVYAASACRYIGRNAEALSHATRADALARGLGDAEVLSRARYGLAISYKCARRFDEALESLQASLDALPAQGADLRRAELLLETADTSLDAGLRPQAEAALAKGSALVHWLREPRLLAWSLYLRSHWEESSPADLQLSAAYEIARKVDYPELQWQILWRLSERAGQQGRDKLQEDCLWNAMAILTRLAESLDADDASAFWRQGPRRSFRDAAQKKFGPQFLQKLMLGEAAAATDACGIIRDLGFDPASLPDFGQTPQA